MQVKLEKISKRYQREWIFKDVSLDIQAGDRIGIIGSNGSGKSTLLKIISTAELASKGTVNYTGDSNQKIMESKVYKFTTFAAPYIDLTEELSLLEAIEFHLKFKSFYHNLSTDDFLDLIQLSNSKDKFIKYFSSGMKQRLKLGFAICCQSELLLLDEPCSNLDRAGIDIYHKLMDNYSENRITIVSSNEDPDELYRINSTLNIMDYK